MLNLKHLALVFCLFLTLQSVNAQRGLTHEVGIIAGPLQFRSDFGAREDATVNFKNAGFGIGLVHYINFSYRLDNNFQFLNKFNDYFNDHFKVRNEISFNKTKLEHLGRWASTSNTSIEADKLRAHEGSTRNLDIGTQLEYFPLSIMDFQGFDYRFAPYVSLGVHYTWYTPEVSTTFGDGDVTNSNNFYAAWEDGSIDATPGNTWSIVSSAGVRYKLNRSSDLLLDLKWQYYFDDKVDGLDHQLPSNKYNDWLLWLNVGYIYYFD